MTFFKSSTFFTFSTLPSLQMMTPISYCFCYTPWPLLYTPACCFSRF